MQCLTINFAVDMIEKKKKICSAGETGSGPRCRAYMRLCVRRRLLKWFEHLVAIKKRSEAK